MILRQILTPTIKFPRIPTQTILIKKAGNLNLLAHPVRFMVKLTIPQIKVTLEQTQLIERLPEQTAGRTESGPTKKWPQQFRWEWSSCSPNFKLETPRSHSVVASDRPEQSETSKFPPIPECVAATLGDIYKSIQLINNTNNESKSQHTQETQKTTVASQTSPPKGIQPENYVAATEQPPGNQTGNKPVPFLNCSNNCSTDIKESEQHLITTPIGDTTIPPLTTTTPLNGEGLVRDEQTNEVYLPLTSTVAWNENNKCASRFRQ